MEIYIYTQHNIHKQTIICYQHSLSCPHLHLSETFNTSLGLSGGAKIKDPVVDATWPEYFTPPLGAFRRDAPTIFRVRSPNNGKVGIKSFARTRGLISM